MHILMVSNEFFPSIGGVQTHVYELSRAMVQLGHHVHVLTRRKGETPLAEVVDGVCVRRCRLANSHLIYDWQLRRQLKRLICEFAIEIIHVHGMRPLNACANLGPLVVFTNHTSGFLRRSVQGGKLRDKMRRQLVIANIVLAPSEELVERTRDTGYAGSVNFIANGVDIIRFSPGRSNLRERLGIPTDAFVVVLARRLVKKNGVLHLAQALSLISDPNIHLLVAGEGVERAEFEVIACGAEHADRVHMLGAVANTDMPDVYRAADVAVLPSLMEATSITGLEAMACGVPLIGTRVGGIPSIIDDGVTGLLVEPADPQAMAAAITLLARQRDRARAMGAASRAKAAQEFAWTEIARQTLDAYRSEAKLPL